MSDATVSRIFYTINMLTMIYERPYISYQEIVQRLGQCKDIIYKAVQKDWLRIKIIDGEEYYYIK